VEEELKRLHAKVQREQTARREAETVAEKSTRALYQAKARLELLLGIAAASNSAQTLDEAVRAALSLICAHTHWPVGHAYLVDPKTKDCHSTTIWQLSDPVKYKEFVTASNAMSFDYGEGLPGRVAESGQPIWIPDLGLETNFPRRAVAIQAGIHSGVAARSWNSFPREWAIRNLSFWH
jgi:hypothetical protein